MAHKVFILSKANGAASFTPASSGSSAINLDSVVDFTYNETGSSTISNSDASPLAQGSYVDDINATVTVNTKNVKQLQDLDVGSYGTLTIRGVLRSQGSGVDTGTTMTYVFAKAIVTDVSGTTPHAGESNGSVTFSIVDNGSGALYATA